MVHLKAACDKASELLAFSFEEEAEEAEEAEGAEEAEDAWVILDLMADTIESIT